MIYTQMFHSPIALCGGIIGDYLNILKYYLTFFNQKEKTSKILKCNRIFPP